ncbi:hypothetical protein MNEG_11834 [Monoraphidium neglectum]|uniref:Uncharacterized protein n=1 Tax=Monoraphidium neglectum TaxID=145388 RepID=A0A0D2J8Q2_9CHLO|nr:hypothetical protein MNEG_11834 [Monoraphidium neglectum]KIY96127.1 hypothetical protein MNEG_11834 [Monoraphidium neglectum]|eukprot:XP_013895147.1 hypothetical protein MNEG_11834 [Monoraphidium neglectum]
MADRSLSRQDSKSGKERFKIIGQVIMAMQRFQASINPTYNYGKADATADQDAALRAAHAHKTTLGRTESRDRTASGRTISGRPTSAGQAHGHKGHLLFRPLPEIPAEAK